MWTLMNDEWCIRHYLKRNARLVPLPRRTCVRRDRRPEISRDVVLRHGRQPVPRGSLRRCQQVLAPRLRRVQAQRRSLRLLQGTPRSEATQLDTPYYLRSVFA